MLRPLPWLAGYHRPDAGAGGDAGDPHRGFLPAPPRYAAPYELYRAGRSIEFIRYDLAFRFVAEWWKSSSASEGKEGGLFPPRGSPRTSLGQYIQEGKRLMRPWCAWVPPTDAESPVDEADGDGLNFPGKSLDFI
ncbi:MAG: hypothetical protein ACLTYN_01605 [Dysosmobacter welbionis]